MFDPRGIRLKFGPGMMIPLLFMGLSLSFENAATQEVPEAEAAAEEEAIKAEAVLAAALAEAEKTDRLVFLHTGADW